MPVDAAAKTYKPQLDGVRALAVMLVVAFHARAAVFPGGYIGVDIFFVLSGYLITGILVGEMTSTGHLSLHRFYIRRALRLIPALVLLCGVVGAVYLAMPTAPHRDATLLGTVGAITYTASPLAASGQFLGAMLHTWSLSVEEYFYIVWPLILVAIHRYRKSWVIWIVSIMLLAVTYRFIGHAVFHWSGQRLAYGADTRFEQLLIGGSLAVILRSRQLRISSWAFFAAAMLLTVFALLPEPLTGGFYLRGGSTIVALIAAIIIANIVTRVEDWPARALSWRPLVWIGQRSYGIYLWNPPIVAIVALTTWGDAFQLVVKLLLSFAIPALSYAYLEKPFLKLKHRFETSSPAPHSETGNPLIANERPGCRAVGGD